MFNQHSGYVACSDIERTANSPKSWCYVCIFDQISWDCILWRLCSDIVYESHPLQYSNGTIWVPRGCACQLACLVYCLLHTHAHTHIHSFSILICDGGAHNILNIIFGIFKDRMLTHFRSGEFHHVRTRGRFVQINEFGFRWTRKTTHKSGKKREKSEGYE